MRKLVEKDNMIREKEQIMFSSTREADNLKSDLWNMTDVAENLWKEIDYVNLRWKELE